MSDHEVFPTRPEPECPKCGHDYGFANSTPRYDANPEIGERLLWDCRYCGYTQQTRPYRPEPSR